MHDSLAKRQDAHEVGRPRRLAARSGVAPGPLQARAGRATLRSVAIVVHRYVGLAMTVFLVVAGLTGSLLAFYHELDAALNPTLFEAHPPSSDAKRLDASTLREKLLPALPAGTRASYLSLRQEPEKSVVFYVDTPEGSDEADTYFVDPYTGAVLGSRRHADLSQGVTNLMPFLHRLHYSLALGTVGEYVLGVAALLWTFDCFVGAYLTFPPARRRVIRERRRKSWLVRWKPSWLVRANTLFSFVFTWHRASGLWIWGMLLVFAWSSVGLNLREVYNPVMKAAFGMDERAYEQLPRLSEPRPEPALSFRQARERGQTLMAERARALGFEVFDECRLSYAPDSGAYRYQVYSSRDVSERYPNTTVYFDGDDGSLIAFETATGQSTGLTLTTWLYHLHWGSVAGGGWLYRLFVSLMGLAVATLSLAGVWIWWRKASRRNRFL